MLSHILIGDDLWGGALRASYDFVLGPVSIQANYSNLGKNVGFYINAGFVFWFLLWSPERSRLLAGRTCREVQKRFW